MNRLCALFLMVLALWTAGASLAPSVAYAQAEKNVDAAADEEGGDAQSTQKENYFIWVIKTSGLIGAVILILSIYFIATVVRLFIDLRPQVVSPPEIVAQCNAFIEQRDFRGLYNFVKADDSFISRTLSAGLSEMPYGLAEAREAMDRVGEAETVDMEKKISMLAVIGTLGPMIGLLGTLKGMIGSFSSIANSTSGAGLNASEVAGHISEALLLTFEGVALSVPAIYLFAVFRNRVSHLSVNAMLQADEMLRQVSQAAKSKAPAQPRPTNM